MRNQFTLHSLTQLFIAQLQAPSLVLGNTTVNKHGLHSPKELTV